LELTNFDRKSFVILQLNFVYDPEAQCTEFMGFVNLFTEGHNDRRELLRSYLNAIVYSRIHYQVFLYLLGPGATGKSILSLIAMAMMGYKACISTT
jgi:phage/plasmid-associated DNA primase